MCNYVKFETGRNLPPVLQTAVCIAHASQALLGRVLVYTLV